MTLQLHSIGTSRLVFFLNMRREFRMSASIFLVFICTYVDVLNYINIAHFVSDKQNSKNIETIERLTWVRLLKTVNTSEQLLYLLGFSFSCENVFVVKHNKLLMPFPICYAWTVYEFLVLERAVYLTIAC